MASSPSEEPSSLRPGLRPLVILGAPRSGTKLLRDLLGRSRKCTVIPYGINHVWRLGLPPKAADRRPATHGTNQRRQKIRSSLLDLAGARRRPPSRYLVEKTCANTLRVPFVDRVLPDALFLHILRDGRDAAVSAREQWNRPPTLRYLLGKLRYVPLRQGAFLLWYLHNLWSGLWSDGRVQYWGPRYEGMRADCREHSLLSVCARQWKSCVTTCLEDLSQISSERVLTIRYENLVARQGTLDRLIERLGLPHGDSIRDHYQRVVHDRSVGRWRRDLSPSEQRMIDGLLQPTLDHIAEAVPLSL